jgi:hypothetical protein
MRICLQFRGFLISCDAAANRILLSFDIFFSTSNLWGVDMSLMVIKSESLSSMNILLCQTSNTLWFSSSSSSWVSAPYFIEIFHDYKGSKLILLLVNIEFVLLLFWLSMVLGRFAETGELILNLKICWELKEESLTWRFWMT